MEANSSTASQRARSITIPVVNFDDYIGGGTRQCEQFVAEVAQASRELGFFYVKNHGIPQAYEELAFANLAEFFALPVNMKEEVGAEQTGGFNGWFDLGARSGNYREGYRIPWWHNGAAGPWPASPTSFQQGMIDFCDGITKIAGGILEALSPNLPQHFSHCGYVQSLRYPPQPIDDTLKFGISEHTNFHALTVVAQDGSSGLQVQNRDGVWLDAPTVKGTLVVIIGDLLARWTNDIFTAAVHRVVNTSDSHRYAIVCAYEPDPEVLVKCLPEHESDERPAKYPPITASDLFQAHLRRIKGNS